MAVIGYARVSTLEQAEEGESLPAQAARISAYCIARGLELAQVVQDPGVSGTVALADRPGGGVLLQALEGRQATGVVAVRLDRLWRSASDCWATVEDWDKGGIALHLIDLGGLALDTRSPTGAFMVRTLASVANLERDLTGQRVRETLAQLQAQGVSIGRAPYGWRYGERDPATGRCALVEVPGELQVVALIRRWRGRGWSWRRIADELTKREIPTRRGGAWFPNTVRRIGSREGP